MTTNRTKIGATAGLVFAGFIAFGCESHPTVGEAFDEIFTAFCQRLQTCNTEGFNQAYPQGVSECVSKAESVTTEDRSQETKCTSDEIDTCKNDISALSCTQVDNISAASLPASCQKC